MNRTAEVTIMIKAAEKAAIGIARDFGELEKLQVSKKGFKDFVTSSDRRAEEHIKYILSKARPEYSFICEETGAQPNPNSDMCWIVDPIDGTANFMRGIPYFSINIALSEKDNTVAGVTFDPMRGEGFRAAIGSGAFLNRQRLRVSGREILRESMLVTHMPPQEELKIAEKGPIVRRTGSVALDLAYLAAGKFDVVIAKNVNIWDIATGILLVKEAGGFINYTKNTANKYDVIATSSNKLLLQVSEILK